MLIRLRAAAVSFAAMPYTAISMVCHRAFLSRCAATAVTTLGTTALTHPGQAGSKLFTRFPATFANTRVVLAELRFRQCILTTGPFLGPFKMPCGFSSCHCVLAVLYSLRL